MLIRGYKPSDFKRINDINQLSFDCPQPEMLLQAEADRGHTWVAEEEGIVVGFVVGKIKLGNPYVSCIAVAYEHRGKGIATKLLEAFEKDYEGLQKPGNKVFWLQVSADNPAQKLYFDLGYRVESIDSNYYGDYKDALCMYKHVKPIYNHRVR
jgi:ribosomal protein S18 acetylase RimI-like enzyme